MFPFPIPPLSFHNWLCFFHQTNWVSQSQNPDTCKQTVVKVVINFCLYVYAFFIPKCADKKIYLVTRQKLDRISQHLYSNRYIEVIVLKTWFQKLLVSCFRRKIMYFSFKVSWYIWVLLKFEALSCVLFVLLRLLILFDLV